MDDLIFTESEDMQTQTKSIYCFNPNSCFSMKDEFGDPYETIDLFIPVDSIEEAKHWLTLAIMSGSITLGQ